MTIIELLKELNTRLNFGNKWLIWDEEWIVYEHIHQSKNSRIICHTLDEEFAVKILTED